MISKIVNGQSSGPSTDPRKRAMHIVLVFLYAIPAITRFRYLISD